MLHETYATRFGLRPIAYGRRGMVATANPLASLAGIRMLAQGGNAVDALIAAAAALGVVEPYMSGLAGCGVLLLTAPGALPKSLVFFGRAPAAAQPGAFRGTRPDVGYLAAAVPGNLAGWARVLADYGTMSLAQVFEPAIEYAERGVPFTVFDQLMFTENRNRLIDEARATYLPGGRVPDAGTVFVQPDLAGTLRQIAAHGSGYLYDGPLGRAIGRWMHERGGLLAEADLQTYPGRLRWESPIETTYRGVTVYAPPPPSSAVQTLETLNILSRCDLGTTPHLGPDHIGLVADAGRAARLDTERYIGDPEMVPVPVETLLSPDHAASLRQDMDRASNADVRPGERLGRFGGGTEASTTHLAAVDSTGLAVNMTQSVGMGFGCGVVVPGTGVCLNNALMWFSMVPGHVNVIAPGKVHEWPLAPLQLFKDRHMWAALGTPGSYGILITTAEIVVNLLDFGLNLQDAIAAPRFRWADEPGDPLPPRTLRVESRIAEETRAALAARGYDVELLGPWTMRVGGAQAIQVERESGWLAGAADPRRNGYAAGW